MTPLDRSIGPARSRMLTVQHTRVTRAKATLADFGKHLATSPNPVHTLRWSDQQYSAAATVEVSSWIIAAMEQGTTLDDILAHLFDKLHYFVTAGGTSTSATSNLVDKWLGVIYAQEHRELGGVIAWIED